MNKSIEGNNRYDIAKYQTGTVVPMIDLEISGKCNLHCPTCWGTPPEMTQQYGLPDWMSLLGNLKKDYGLESIALTGGEPLLVPEITGFIKNAREDLGLNVNLLTNGLGLGKHFAQAEPYLSSISVPLDGSNDAVNSESRGKGHFRVATDWIFRLNTDHPELPLKVGTVVSTVNVDDIENIGEILIARGISDRPLGSSTWKLYQATAFGAQQESPVWETRKVGDKVFEQLVESVTNKFKGRVNLASLSTEETGGYCIIIRPNGNIVTNSKIDGTELRIAENIFEDTDGAMRAIADYHPQTRGVKRMATSYLSQGLHTPLSPEITQ